MGYRRSGKSKRGLRRVKGLIVLATMVAIVVLALCCKACGLKAGTGYDLSVKEAARQEQPREEPVQALGSAENQSRFQGRRRGQAAVDTVL